MRTDAYFHMLARVGGQQWSRLLRSVGSQSKYVILTNHVAPVRPAYSFTTASVNLQLVIHRMQSSGNNNLNNLPIFPVHVVAQTGPLESPPEASEPQPESQPEPEPESETLVDSEPVHEHEIENNKEETIAELRLQLAETKAEALRCQLSRQLESLRHLGEKAKGQIEHAQALSRVTHEYEAKLSELRNQANTQRDEWEIQKNNLKRRYAEREARFAKNESSWNIEKEKFEAQLAGHASKPTKLEQKNEKLEKELAGETSKAMQLNHENGNLKKELADQTCKATELERQNGDLEKQLADGISEHKKEDDWQQQLLHLQEQALEQDNSIRLQITKMKKGAQEMRNGFKGLDTLTRNRTLDAAGYTAAHPESLAKRPRVLTTNSQDAALGSSSLTTPQSGQSNITNLAQLSTQSGFIVNESTRRTETTQPESTSAHMTSNENPQPESVSPAQEATLAQEDTTLAEENERNARTSAEPEATSGPAVNKRRKKGKKVTDVVNQFQHFVCVPGESSMPI